METPSGATTETTSATPDGSAANSQGAESPPAAAGASEKSRIDELTGNWRETQRDRDYWRDRYLATERQGSNRQTNGSDANNGADGSEGDEEIKTLADFKYDEKAYGKYLRELGRNDAKREADAVRREITEGQTAAQRREAVGDFQERAENWAKAQKLENFEQMFASPADGGPAVSDSMAEAIMTSDHGPEILHYLTKNKAESRRIHKLSPVQQAREIGRLEAKFASGPAQSSVSGAPPPPPQVKGASDTSVKKDPAQMTDAEWWAEKQRSNKARRAQAGARK